MWGVQLAPVQSLRDIQPMISRLRVAHLLLFATSGAILLAALGAEWWGGLVPCALCLVERWPWRVAVAHGVVGLLLPRGLARVALWGGVVALAANVVAGAVHVGVESGWWPSPRPQCQAPRIAAGLTAAERLARMPDHPSVACEEPTYLVPRVPVSMAEANTIAALALAASLATFLLRTRGSQA